MKIGKFINILLIFLVIVLTISVISYLVNQDHQIKQANQEIIALQKKNKQLKNNLEKTKKDKQIFISLVNEKLLSIEKLLDVNDTNSVSLNNKLNFISNEALYRRILLENIPSGTPVKYLRITSSFGWRIHPTEDSREFHPGIDLKTNMKTPVLAPADGIVEYAGGVRGYGRLLMIRHNLGFQTFYGHLNKIIVKYGQFVKKGEVIAYTGNSGLSTGPHLHYEIRYLGQLLNPYYFINWNFSNFDFIFKKEQKVKWEGIQQAVKWQMYLFNK